MRRAVVTCCAALIIETAVAGASPHAAPGDEFLTVENGRIVLSGAAGRIIQLTSGGSDSDPMFSPDRQSVAFVCATPSRKVDTGSGNDTSELWLVRRDGSNPVRLVQPHAAHLDSVVAEISNPHFSCDGKRIFFQTTAWTTSGAVHVVDLATKREHFVCAGDGLRIVRAGDYRDCLLVQQHRYFIGGGSFDWFWLFRPNGKEIGPVGEDTENFEASYATQ